MAKAKLTYAVRETLAPGETVPTLVPVIVDRRQPVDLAEVIENCIDIGLIAGLKATAAHGIAEGIAEQIYKEFTNGNGVAFGQYFYGRLYLNGTVSANGNLTSDNKVNVRLMKGNDFKLTKDSFTMSFDGDATSPKLENVVNSANGTRGLVVLGADVTLNGANLNAAGDTNLVTFTEVGAEGEPQVVTVDAFKAAGPDILTFECPATLVGGRKYDVKASRTDVNGIMRNTNVKTVSVSGTAPTPPAPVTTLTNVKSAGGEDGVVTDGTEVEFTGTNLGIDGSRLQVRVDNGSTPEDEFVNIDTAYLDAEHSTDTRLVASDGMWSSLHDSGIGETGQNLIWKYKGATIAATVG